MGSLSPEELHAYNDRLKQRETSAEREIWALLDSVSDPEIPALSLWDLGVLSDIAREKEVLTITITPTYSGCPAMDVMREDLQAVLHANGYQNVHFKIKLAPAWSSDWISPEGREKMRQYGIAPPDRSYCSDSCGGSPTVSIACPHCGGSNTQQISEFGSTACKALHQCQSCLEPFDYFKSL